MRDKNLPEHIAPPPPPPRSMTLKERIGHEKAEKKERVYPEKPDTSRPTNNFIIEEGHNPMDWFLWNAFLFVISWSIIAILILYFIIKWGIKF